MIFVTVGTTLMFDELMKMIDRLVEEKRISERVVCQIGNGKYVPKHCEYFRFMPSIDDWIQNASLVISHGGATVFELLSLEKPFIAVANPRGADNHQTIFLEKLSKVVPILWTRDVNELPSLIERAATFIPQAVKRDSLADDLRRYLLSPQKKEG